MKYYERIKDLREDEDLKQEDIAKILKTTKQYYGQYELNKRELPIRHLIKLCEFYNVSADYILGFTNTKKPITEEKKETTIITGKDLKIRN